MYFFKPDFLLNFNIKNLILKTCFKEYVETLRKNDEFTLLNEPLKLCKLH